MKHVLASVAMAAVFTAQAYAQPPEPTAAPEAAVTIEGADQGAPVTTTETQPPANTPIILSKTTVEETPTATIEQTSETVIPVSNRPALNAENPIAPEVQAVVDTKKHYTTADLANAQLAAVLATPNSEPITTITTTRTTPKSDG